MKELMGAAFSAQAEQLSLLIGGELRADAEKVIRDAAFQCGAGSDYRFRSGADLRVAGRWCIQRRRQRRPRRGEIGTQLCKI